MNRRGLVRGDRARVVPPHQSSGAPPPSVTAIAPASGFTFGGQDRTITMSSTVGITGITLNGQAVQYWDVVDATHVHVFTGAAGSAGTGNVVVNTSNGAGVLTNGWTYALWTPSSFTDASGTTHTPTFLVDETSVTQSSNLVTAWPDQSGAGLLTPTAAGAARPGWSAAGGPTGNGCLTFDGAAQALDCGAGTPSSTKYFTALCVFKGTSGTFNQYQFLFGKQAANFNWAMGGSVASDHTLMAYGSTGSAVYGYSHRRLDDGNWHWALMIWDGTSMSSSQGTVRLIVDGEVQQSRRIGAAYAALPTSTDHVGIGSAIPTSAGFLYTGSITMVCSWDALPSLQSIKGIIDLMNRKYGLTSNPVLRSSSPGVGALAGADLTAIVDANGNIDVEVPWTSTVSVDSSNQATSGWIWQGQSTDGTALSGTVSVTNGQPGITFSTAQTLPAGSRIQFGSQAATTYVLSADVNAGTSGTLSGNYTGTTNAATSTTCFNMGVCYHRALDEWQGWARGVKVLSAPDQNGVINGPWWLNGDTPSIRFMYKPATVSLPNAFIFKYNGCYMYFTTAGSPASGSALAAATSASIGQAIDGSNAIGASGASLITRSSFANTTLECKCEGLLIGDSLTHRATLLASVDRYFYTAAEAAARPGVRSIGCANDKLTDSKYFGGTDWEQGDPTFNWLLFEYGTNDVFTFALGEPTIVSNWNTWIPNFKAWNIKSKLIAQSIPPYSNQQAKYGDWKAVLGDMGVPGYTGVTGQISGWDVLDTAPTLGALNDGSDNLAAAYTSSGGAPHFNNAGCALMAGYKHAAVRAQGLI